MHSTYAVVLSTRDPNIPWYHGRCRWKRATSARTCCLYTFDIVVATPARVLSASSKKHASRGRQRGTTKQMPLVLYARVGEHARAVSPAATSTQDERANADWHGVKRRRVNYKRLSKLRRAEFVEISSSEDAKMRTLF